MKISNISYNYNYSLVANHYYNPRISQFYATDPLAEKYPGINPYVYTADNPVMLVDPDGLDWYKNNKTGEITWFDGNGKQKGYTYLGYSISMTDADGNRIVYDPVTRSKIVNGEFEESWGGNLDEVVITVNSDKNIKSVKAVMEYYSENSNDYNILGVYANLQEKISLENSKYIYKYGSGELSAAEMTANNTQRMLKISKNFKYLGRGIAVVGVFTSLYQYDKGDITGYRLTSDLFFTFLPFVMPGVGTVISGAYFIGTAIYDF